MNLNQIFSDEYLQRYKICEWGYTEEDRPINYGRYKNWIEESKHVPLNYLSDFRMGKRESLKEFYPSFQSAIVFLFSYHDVSRALRKIYDENSSNQLKIASYTLGFDGYDYHEVLRDRLVSIGNDLALKFENLDFVLTIDMHPVMERDLALRAGLGWAGKNSMQITRKSGSFFIIGSLLFNQKISSAISPKIETDHCGQCTRCVDACPTEAIDPFSRTIKASDCISTFTIEEFKLDARPSDKMDLNSGFIFGCDICQDVCPWNVRLDRSLEISKKEYYFSGKQKEMIDFFLMRDGKEIENEINQMSNKQYKNKFQKTSFERSGKRGLLKNLKFYHQKKD